MPSPAPRSYLVERGKYRAGEHWGYEVRASGGSKGSRSYEAWRKAGVVRADGQPFPQPNGDREALGAGARRAGASCSDRISTRCAPTTRR